MKSFIRCALATSLLGAVATPVLAADLPSRIEQPTYVAPAPVFTWSGFYAGAEFGGQWGHDSGYIVNNYTANSLLSSGAYPLTGVVGGGLIGYNYQVQSLVVGLEGDLEGSSNQGRFTSVHDGSVNTQYGFGAGARARLGYAWDRFLPYLTGGYAFEDISHTYNYWDGFALRNPNTNTGRSGYTLGAGLEYAFAPNWSARLEYRYTDYGRYVQTYNQDVSLQYNTQDNAIRAGVSYHFAPSIPTVVKY